VWGACYGGYNHNGRDAVVVGSHGLAAAPGFAAGADYRHAPRGARPAEASPLVCAAAALRLANGLTLIGKFDGAFAAGSQTYAGTVTIRYAW